MGVQGFHILFWISLPRQFGINLLSTQASSIVVDIVHLHELVLLATGIMTEKQQEVHTGYVTYTDIESVYPGAPMLPVTLIIFLKRSHNKQGHI